LHLNLNFKVTSQYEVKSDSSRNDSMLDKSEWLTEIERFVEKYDLNKLINCKINLSSVFIDDANDEITLTDFKKMLSSKLKKLDETKRPFNYEFVESKNKRSLLLYGYHKETKAFKEDFVAPELEHAETVNNLHIAFTKDTHFQMYIMLTEFEGNLSLFLIYRIIFFYKYFFKGKYLSEMTNDLKKNQPTIFKRIVLNLDEKKALVFYKGKENKQLLVNYIFKTFFSLFEYRKAKLKSENFAVLKKHELINRPDLLYARFSYTSDYIEFVGLKKYVDKIVNYIKTGDEKETVPVLIEIDSDSSSDMNEAPVCEETEGTVNFGFELTELRPAQIKLLEKISIVWMLTEMFEGLKVELIENKETGTASLMFTGSSVESVDQAKEAMVNALDAMIESTFKFPDNVDLNKSDELFMADIDRLGLHVVIETIPESNTVLVLTTSMEDFEACKSIFETVN
jgi:hypothetical protein